MPSHATRKSRILKRKQLHASRKVKRPMFAEPPQDLASLVRGMYVRVARSLHVDPSYVSRVARGERHSELVDAALRRELNRVVRYASTKHPGSGRTSTPVKIRKG